MRDIAAKSNEVVAGLGVPYTWITSYVAGDKIYCVHEAASAGVIERHAREGGFPANKITEVSAIIGPATARASSYCCGGMRLPEHLLPIPKMPLVG